MQKYRVAKGSCTPTRLEQEIARPFARMLRTHTHVGTNILHHITQVWVGLRDLFGIIIYVSPNLVTMRTYTYVHKKKKLFQLCYYEHIILSMVVLL
jgi:hypothetical protein